jgi:hypothetical protein
VRVIGYIWGISGVLGLLLFAIYRLAPMALALTEIPLTALHWSALLFSVFYMAYAEGYKGFHKGFAPRVVSRAHYLQQNPRLGHILLAPLFCMGYFYATKRRQLLSYGLTTMILCFILIARQLPQPWRGILDAGVVVGLTIGVLSIGYFMIIARTKSDYTLVPSEVPSEIPLRG